MVSNHFEIQQVQTQQVQTQQGQTFAPLYFDVIVPMGMVDGLEIVVVIRSGLQAFIYVCIAGIL